MTESTLTRLIIKDIKKLVSAIDFSLLSNKSILITGASGLIGTYILASLTQARKLSKLDFKVTITTYSEIAPYLKELMLPCDSVTKIDLADYLKTEQLDTFDFIFHSAGYGQPGKFMINPIKTICLNSTLTAQLLGHLRRGGRFLFVSSSEVYSGLTKPPFTEEQIGTTNPQHPRACYIEGKRSGEAICSNFPPEAGTAVSARLSLAYGPGVKFGDARVLNSFIQKSLADHQIKMLDLGDARRTYCYVADAVEMLLKIWLFGKHKVYNVGGVSRTTIKGLAQKIGDLTKSKVLVPESGQKVTGSPEDVYSDLSLYDQEFGLPLYLNLNDGLINTINWYEELAK